MLVVLLAALVALLALGWVREFGIALWRRHRERRALRARWRAVRAACQYYRDSPLCAAHRAAIDPRSDPPLFLPSEMSWRGTGGVPLEVPHDCLEEDIAGMEARMRGEWSSGTTAQTGWRRHA